MSNFLLAIDPGRAKCGIAVLDYKSNIIKREIIAPENLVAKLGYIFSEFLIEETALGNATFSEEIRAIIKENFPNIRIALTDEKHSTEKGKTLYFKHNPPKGVWRFIPKGLQTPKEPYDDFAAAAIGMEYLRGRS